MKARSLSILTCVALALTLGCSSAVLGDSLIAVVPAGKDCFAVQGSLEGDVVSIDISIDYDQTTLGSPVGTCARSASHGQCQIGSGRGGFAQVHITSATPLNGTMVFGTLNFTRLGSGPGKINSIDAHLLDKDGVVVPTNLDVQNPTVGMDDRAPMQLKKERTPRPSPPDAEGGVGRGAQDPATWRLESVLERFRGSPQQSSLESLIPLFDRTPAREFSQNPPIAISDGTGTVRLTLEPEESGDTPPRFALQGMHCLSCTKGEGRGWIIEVLPERGAFEATLTVLNGSAALSYPLTVSPPLASGGGELGPEDFALRRETRTLSKAASGKVTGRPGFLDDYIYTANYLVKKRGVPPREASR